MYTLEKAETEVREYVELVLFQHDMHIHTNDTHRKIYDKIVRKCMNDLTNTKLLRQFTNAPQLQYFVRQTILYLILK